MSKIKKALLKAKEARELQPQGIEVTELPKVDEVEVELENIVAGVGGPHFRKDLEVSYQQTRVYNLDPNVLHKNKLYAIFKNNKVTDNFDIAKGLLLKKLDKLDGNCLIVTSANPGEGKTFASLNLGISIAREHDRTALVIDADLRNPWRSHRDFANDFFSLTPDKGLVDYLEGKVDLNEIIINPGINKLTIIPAGRRALNSAELLSSPRMEYLIKELKRHYGKQRVLIFDCPATLSCVDSIVFSQLVDGILFVVESERTTSDELKKAMALYKDKPILGVILNKTKDDEDTEMKS